MDRAGDWKLDFWVLILALLTSAQVSIVLIYIIKLFKFESNNKSLHS